MSKVFDGLRPFQKAELLLMMFLAMAIPFHWLAAQYFEVAVEALELGYIKRRYFTRSVVDCSGHAIAAIIPETLKPRVRRPVDLQHIAEVETAYARPVYFLLFDFMSLGGLYTVLGHDCPERRITYAHALVMLEALAEILKVYTRVSWRRVKRNDTAFDRLGRFIARHLRAPVRIEAGQPLAFIRLFELAHTDNGITTRGGGLRERVLTSG